MGAATENMERLAAENDIEIEFATDVLHAINRDIAEPTTPTEACRDALRMSTDSALPAPSG